MPIATEDFLNISSDRPAGSTGVVWCLRDLLTTYTGTTEGSVDHASTDSDVLRAALAQQQDEEAHDRSMIVERLAWTPEQRLEANATFLRFYLAVRPSGPLIRDE